MDRQQKKNTQPKRQIGHKGRGKYNKQQEKGKQITAEAQKKSMLKIIWLGSLEYWKQRMIY